MKKLFLMLCLFCVLFLNCSSAEKTDDNNQNINREILGEIYIEKNAGFTMYIPKGWQIRDYSLKYSAIVEPLRRDFTININLADERYSGAISEYIIAGVGYLSKLYTEFEVSESKKVKTNSGLNGEYIILQGRINKINVRQKSYFIQNKKATDIMVITCTVPHDVGDKYDAVFDECVKTFTWAK